MTSALVGSLGLGSLYRSRQKRLKNVSLICKTRENRPQVVSKLIPNELRACMPVSVQMSPLVVVPRHAVADVPERTGKVETPACVKLTCILAIYLLPRGRRLAN